MEYGVSRFQCLSAHSLLQWSRGASWPKARELNSYVTILSPVYMWFDQSKLFNIFSSLRSSCLIPRRFSQQLLDFNKLRFVFMACEPPPKRSKKEVTEHGGDILESYMAKRKEVCKSVTDFKFNKKRVRLISSDADIPENCKGIAYWMWREQRVQGWLKHACCNLSL